MESINPKDHRKISWSELPPDLLISIIERLDLRYDIFNLRRVCKTWRTTVSLTLVSKNILSHLIPHSFSSRDATIADLRVGMGSVIRIQSLVNPNIPPCLLTVIEITSGKLYIKSPLFHHVATRQQLNQYHHNLPEDFPRVLDLSRFRVSELSRFHILIYKINSMPKIMYKVQLIKDPNCENCATINNYTLVEIVDMSRTQPLSATRVVASNVVEKHDVIFEAKERIKIRDLVEFKGKIYAVDNVGKLYSMDYHTLKMSMITKVDTFKSLYYLETTNTKKYLVVSSSSSSSSELYLVCRKRTKKVKSDHFSVFKLNEELKKWDKITSIGDNKILFVTFNGCYFASTNDFPGWKGNCIVFHYDKYIRPPSSNKYVVGVFHLDSGDYGTLDSFPGYSNVLWPPPSWLWTDTCSSTGGD